MEGRLEVGERWLLWDVFAHDEFVLVAGVSALDGANGFEGLEIARCNLL